MFQKHISIFSCLFNLSTHVDDSGSPIISGMENQRLYRFMDIECYNR